jgi:hypothetical protein
MVGSMHACRVIREATGQLGGAKIMEHVRKIWRGVGEGATGIEPETAPKQGMQRHQTPRDGAHMTHILQIDPPL